MRDLLSMIAMLGVLLPAAVWAEEQPMSRDQLFDYIAQQEEKNAELHECKNMSDVHRLFCFVAVSGEVQNCNFLRVLLKPAKGMDVLNMIYSCVRMGTLVKESLQEVMCEMLKDEQFPHVYAHCLAYMQETVASCQSIQTLESLPAMTMHQNDRDIMACLLHHAQRLQDQKFCDAAQAFYDKSPHQKFLPHSEGLLEKCPNSYHPSSYQ